MTSILCIGNFGTGKKEQFEIAELLNYLCDKYNSKFILGLGNNIYPNGVSSLNDKSFTTKFEIPYSILPNNIKFYNILGNKDYHHKKSPQYQINYSKINDKWILPNNFYCFTKKFNKIPVEFIGLDTNLEKMKNKSIQEKWAVNTLFESKARWRIIFSHHPWVSVKKETSEQLDKLYSKIVDTGKIDLIISGHDGCQQHIYIPEKPNMIISGVGGNSYPKDIIIKNELKFSSNESGCIKIDITKNTLKITFFNVNKDIIYGFTIKKIN